MHSPCSYHQNELLIKSLHQPQPKIWLIKVYLADTGLHSQRYNLLFSSHCCLPLSFLRFILTIYSSATCDIQRWADHCLKNQGYRVILRDWWGCSTTQNHLLDCNWKFTCQRWYFLASTTLVYFSKNQN